MNVETDLIGKLGVVGWAKIKEVSPKETWWGFDLLDNLEDGGAIKKLF